ncbi:MAG: RsmD family RNA methyltransferase [Planctomycetales bacterium]|nr:RsmD family RNA methyltransferase [Planctomycetales bacterium]
MSAHRKKPPRGNRSRPGPQATGKPIQLRIVGGSMRGRRLRYAGDTRVRPMKDRVRETLFNLVGPSVKGTHVLDMFAGTGAAGLEAISRGAEHSTFVEQHLPTWKVVQENIESLEVQTQCDLLRGDAFHLAATWSGPPTARWLVLCCPPYRFFTERTAELMDLLSNLRDRAPVDSIVVVEADGTFDFSQLPDAARWDVRSYPPAVLGIFRKG